MQTEIVSMSQQELEKVHVIERIMARRLSQTTGAKQLGLSTRQLRCLMGCYQHAGAKGLISKGRGKPSNNRVSETICTEAIGLIQSHYHDFGPTLRSINTITV